MDGSAQFEHSLNRPDLCGCQARDLVAQVVDELVDIRRCIQGQGELALRLPGGFHQFPTLLFIERHFFCKPLQEVVCGRPFQSHL